MAAGRQTGQGDGEAAVTIENPGQCVGMSLEAAVEQLGRPRARMRKSAQIVLMYDGFTLLSDDGKTVQFVDMGGDEE